MALARQTGRLSLTPLQQRTAESRRRLVESQIRQGRALTQFLLRTRQRLGSETKLLAALGYKSVLARGFAVVRDHQGRPLRGVTAIRPEAALELEMSDGKLDVVAKPGKQGALF